LRFSQSGDHPESNLAKFGCIIDKKVEKKTVSFYILGYLLEIVISLWRFGIFKNSISGKFGPFFSRKILCKV
jgi:hypothetical protein